VPGRGTRRGARVLALDTPRHTRPTVAQREAFMAHRIAMERAAEPWRRVVVLVGEYHLAAGGLPARLAATSDGRTRVLAVFQNASFLDAGVRDAAGGSPGRAPGAGRIPDPQHASDPPSPRRTLMHLRGGAGEIDETSYDPVDRMHWLISVLADYLDLASGHDVPFELFTDVELLCAALRRRGAGPGRLAAVRREMLAAGSIVLPAQRWALLANPLLNHARRSGGPSPARGCHRVQHRERNASRGSKQPSPRRPPASSARRSSNPDRRPQGLAALPRPCRPARPPGRGAGRHAPRGDCVAARRQRARRSIRDSWRCPASCGGRWRALLGHELGAALIDQHIAGALSRAELRQRFLSPLDALRAAA
jgi:hypothetical protein